MENVLKLLNILSRVEGFQNHLLFRMTFTEQNDLSLINFERDVKG